MNTNRARFFPQLALLLLLWSSQHALAQTTPGSGTTPGMDHSHLPIAAPATAPMAALSLVLSRDAMSGFNLVVQLANYSMGPPPAGVTAMRDLMQPSLDSASGYVAGHAHLYVNGTKIQRIYGTDIHLPANLFQSGINQVAVTLNNHGHMYWTQDERQLIATLFIDPRADQPVIYRFESFPVPAEREPATS